MTPKKNNRDAIIEEIHQTRREILEQFDGDIAAILADARRRQAASGRPIWQGKVNTQDTAPATQGDHNDD